MKNSLPKKLLRSSRYSIFCIPLFFFLAIAEFVVEADHHHLPKLGFKDIDSSISGEVKG